MSTDPTARLYPTLFVKHPDDSYTEIPLASVREWFAPTQTFAEGTEERYKHEIAKRDIVIDHLHAKLSGK